MLISNVGFVGGMNTRFLPSPATTGKGRKQSFKELRSPDEHVRPDFYAP